MLDISLVPISEWDATFSRCDDLIGRTTEIQGARRREAGRQENSQRAREGGYIGTAIAAVQVVDSSAVLITYDSLYVEAIQRISGRQSTPLIPIGDNTAWRDALFTM